MSEAVEEREEDTRHRELVIDNVLSTQPELGPSIPEGGYGWIVFVVTLFFQLLIPSLLVSFGVFLAFSRMKTDFANNPDPKLWDHQILYVPLFFVASWTCVDPISRTLITQSTWPKLFAVAGTCLTCAGMLFVWMGMTGENSGWLFVLSGVITGIGGSIQMAQCDILMAQHFKLRLPALTHISHAFSAVGFIMAPLILGRHMLTNTETQVLLWYQALILQGLVLNLFLRKPMYLKSNRNAGRYDYITTAPPDDEEDIFSKNSRELQIKVQSGNDVKIERHQLPQASNEDAGGPSTPSRSDTPGSHHNGSNKDEELTKDWVTFEEEEGEATKYKKVHQWETFDGEPPGDGEPKQWETFEDELQSSARNSRNLHLEMSFGREQGLPEKPSTTAISGVPIPLFSDTPVNNNTSYSYDAYEDLPGSLNSSVFMPNPVLQGSTPLAMKDTVELLRTPTFYKSLLTVITTKWSLFVFFALFPSFLLQEVKDIHLTQMCNLVGTVSVATLLFAGFGYWINVEKRWRAKMVWFLSWFGALGYFLISDYFTEELLLFGSVMIVLSIAVLQHIGAPLLGLTVKGEPTKEYTLISVLTGLTFLFFVLLNASFKHVFRMMALLNFLTGSVWLSNYIYKRVRTR